MERNFRFSNIYLVQPPYELDLHNDFAFTGLEYSIADRSLLLSWQRSSGHWVQPSTPAAVSIEFRDVSEFRFMPRDSEMPFTEDRCVSDIGYWTDEEWSDGVILTEGDPDPRWLTAFLFHSGAIIAVQATSASALIEP